MSDTNNNEINNTSRYSIDDDDDDDDDDYHQLEGNYSDDDDDDISVEDDEQGEGDITALASRTNHLINSYRDYIAEMSSDPLSSGGDADAAAAVMESDKSNNDDNAMSIEEGTPTTKTTNRTPGAKRSIQRFQDERKGATIYRDFNYKNDPLHCNLHNTQYHHGDNNASSTFFATYDDSHDIPQSNRRRQYHYSMFRSPTFRKCMLGLLTLGSIIGISVGIVKSQQQKKDLPDWEGMLAEEEEVTTSSSNNVAVGAIAGGGGVVATTTEQQPSNSQPIDSHNAYEIQMMYQNSATKYHPIFFSREQGYQGQTYDAAMSYCASQMGGLIMCPYEAICPAGVESLPLGGVKAGTAPNGATWIPFIDEMNAWAQIGSSGKLCEKHNGAPRWGITGEGNEGITRYVACCQGGTSTAVATFNPNSPSSNKVEEEFISQMQMQKYNPQWFDRTSGWEGETYKEAISFCAKKGKMTICPYDAYCPEGPNYPPYGGVKVGFDGEQEQWAPIMNKSNDWVQIGPNNKCKTKGQIQGDSHALTFAQEGSKAVTQHLLCCHIVEEEKDGY